MQNVELSIRAYHKTKLCGHTQKLSKRLSYLCFTDNLAIFQTASQESTASKGSTKQWPINAVDSSPHGTCSQTNPWKQTWWTVDLGENRYVAGTIITVPFLPGKFGIYVFLLVLVVASNAIYPIFAIFASQGY